MITTARISFILSSDFKDYSYHLASHMSLRPRGGERQVISGLRSMRGPQT